MTTFTEIDIDPMTKKLEADGEILFAYSKKNGLRIIHRIMPEYMLMGANHD